MTPDTIKLTVERAALLPALASLARIVERKSAIPILGNVLLEAEGGSLTLTATDLDIRLSRRVPADVAAEGQLTVPAHLFHEIARKLPEGCQISLEADEAAGRIALKAGRARFNLQTLPASDYPDWSARNPDEGEPARFALPATDLAYHLATVRFAISTEETRYYLNGVHLHAGPDPQDSAAIQLHFVATDCHRLAWSRLAAPAGAEAMPGIILPTKAVNEIARLAEEQKAEAEISLTVWPGRIEAEAGETRLTSKLIDGTFPDYRRAVPSAHPHTLILERAPFAAALERVMIINTGKEARAVRLALGEGEAAVSMLNPDAGQSEETLPADTDEAGPSGQTIGFNGRYMLDALNALGGDTARLQLADPGSPIRLERLPGTSPTIVIMPMRV